MDIENILWEKCSRLPIAEFIGWGLGALQGREDQKSLLPVVSSCCLLEGSARSDEIWGKRE